MTRQRDIKLDLLRIIACAMVVLMHSPMPSTGDHGMFLTAVSYFTAPCIGLFFMVSGALLMPVRTDYLTFIKRRFTKIAVPALVWSVIYIGLNALHNGGDAAGIMRALCSIPFSAQGSGVMWFMYTMSGLYLLAPILSAWADGASRQELQVVLGLWAVTLCYPLLEHFVGITTGTTGILYYFTGYAGYFLLGYYLKRYPDALPLRWTLPLGMSGIVLGIVLKYNGIQFDFYRLFWYESIFIAALAVSIWRLADNMLKFRLLRAGNRGGGFSCRIIQPHLWHISDSHNCHAQLALADGIDSGNPLLYSADRRDLPADIHLVGGAQCRDIVPAGRPVDNRQQQPKVRQTRFQYIDTLRVIACFLVILTHANMGGDAGTAVWVGLISFIGSPSSELFLSLSGAVLLPVKTSTGEFYKRRFMKLIPPVAVWSVVIVTIYWLTGQRSSAEAVKSLLLMPLRPAVGVYWFVYVMAGLYLFAPFISKWLKDASRRSIELFLLIWCVNLAMPYMNLLFPAINYNPSGSHYWQLNYFGGFVGYWILGYYLRMYPIRLSLNPRCLAVIIGSAAYCAVIAGLKLNHQPVEPYMDNLQIGSAFLVALLYTLAQSFQIKSRRINGMISDIAKCSFGIYLIHIVVVRNIVWHFFSVGMMNPALQSVVVALCSLMLCYVSIKVLSFLPGSKYIVGI